MPTKKGKLKPNDEARISRNYQYLLEEIDAKELAPALADKVLTTVQVSDIFEIQGRLERNRKLIGFILESGPGASYTHFVEALREKYPHVLYQLNRPVYDWYTDIEEPIKQHQLTQNDFERIAPHLTTKWEVLMRHAGLTDKEIADCKLWNKGEDKAKAELLKCWASRGNSTVDHLMTCFMKEEDREDERATIEWEGLQGVIKAIDLTDGCREEAEASMDLC